MSSKPAAIPLFADAYLADTMHLSTEEHGAYLLLLMAAWRQDDCSLPNDDRKLARIAGLSPRKWAAMRATILEFWEAEEGKIYQARLRKERAYVLRKSEANRQNVGKRWEKQAVENKGEEGYERIYEDDTPPPPPPPIEPKGSLSPLPPENPFAGEAWDGWIAMRWKIKRPASERAIKLAIGKLTKLQAQGQDPDAVLDQSTLKNWTDLYPVKGDYQNGRAGADKRDGFARALDRRLGLDDASGAAGQHDAGASGGSGPRRLAGPAALR